MVNILGKKLSKDLEKNLKTVGIKIQDSPKLLF